MTAFTYSQELVWGSLGGVVRQAGGARSVSILDPATNLPPVLTQGGSTVLWLTADPSGLVSFTATSDTVLADFGAGPMTLYSTERLAVVGTGGVSMTDGALSVAVDTGATKAKLSATYVGVTGNQTVAGAKNFTMTPTVNGAPIGGVLVTKDFFSSGTLVVGVGAQRVYNDTGRTLTFVAIRATLVVAPTGAAAILDVSKGGVTIFGTQANRPTIAIGTFTALGGAVSVTTWAPGEYVTVDCDQVGSTIAGADLGVTVTAQ